MGASQLTSNHKVNIFRRMIRVLAKKNLPNNMKRMMFISSTLGIITKVKHPDFHLIEQLNDIFHMAQYTEAIKFPMYIKNIIWSDLESCTISLPGKEVNICEINITNLTYNQRAELADLFVLRAPDWIKYGNDSEMKLDLVTLLSNFNLLTDDGFNKVNA
jgi:hypothetical protein